MEVIHRKSRTAQVICIGSIVWAVAALLAGFLFEERRVQIVGFMCGPLGMPLNFVLLLPFVFIPARLDPHYILASFGIAAAFLIQWQLVAWYIRRRFRRGDRLRRHARA